MSCNVSLQRPRSGPSVEKSCDNRILLDWTGPRSPALQFQDTTPVWPAACIWSASAESV